MVRIVGLPISLWDRVILRRVWEECGGFLAINSQTEKRKELQWVRILVKLNREDLPNTVKIWVEDVCYSLTLWWETRPILSSLSVVERGKLLEAVGEVEGEVSSCAGERVMEDDVGPRLKDQLQSADGTNGQTSKLGYALDHFRGLVGSSVGP